MREELIRPTWGGIPLIALAAMLGCAGAPERSVTSELRRVSRQDQTGGIDTRERVREPELDGTLQGYVAHAMRHSPELRSSFQRWRAAVLRITRARRLPEPTLRYTYYVRSVETRVGPQRHRLGLKQAFPWPTKLTAGADAASHAARGAQRKFEARALELERRVARLYWKLWKIHRVHHIANEQEAVLESLVESVRARVETGKASMADLLQVQLTLERHRDHHAAHGEMMRQVSAELVSVIGAPPGTDTPVNAQPPHGGTPAMDREALWRAASSHPELKKFEAMARSNEAAARRVRADRLPGFAVGVDWIETGGARGAGVQDSGKDPFMVSVSMDLPLWQASYRDEEQAARAEAAAHRADGEAALRDVEAELERALSDVRDADRRIRLYQHTLVPQGETTLSSLRGSYEVGKSTLAQVLMAERRLLDLRDSLAQARADHARAWARLEEIVGQDVPREASEGTHVSPDKPAEGSTQGAGEAAEAASDEGKRDDE